MPGRFNAGPFRQAPFDPSHVGLALDGASAVRRLVDQDALPATFPTHRQSDAFWAALGRAVATFGFLEWSLRRAIFALSGDRPAPEDEAELSEALADWNERLTKVSTSTLGGLTKVFEEAARNHDRADSVYVAGLVQSIGEASDIRNAICHASWERITDDSARPLYVAAKVGGVREPSIFETPVDIEWLDQVRRHTAELSCAVMNTVTTLGLPFPGSGMKKGRPPE